LEKEITMKKSIFAVAAVAAALLFVPIQAAGQEDLTCNSTYTGGTYKNVTVPPEGSCVLVNTRVLGSVTAGEGTSLTILGDEGTSTIKGDVIANGCVFVRMFAGTPPSAVVVGGNLTIQNCGGDNRFTGLLSPVLTNVLIGKNVKCKYSGYCTFQTVIVGGNFECSGNSGQCNVGPESAIGGNATFNNNLGGGLAGFGLGETPIGGNLSCSGNYGVYHDVDIGYIAGTGFGQCATQ
jgi:hypothetical protein